MKFRHAAALLLGTLLAGACSDSTGSDDAPRPGTFRGSLSGEVSGSFRGRALMVGGIRRPEDPLVIHLSDDRIPGRTRLLALVAPSRPFPGEYAAGRVGSGVFGAEFDVFDEATGSASLSLPAKAGTITIEAAGPEEVRGSYDLVAEDGPVAGPRTTVRATGRFSAVPVSVD